jgi:hypothetical protein
MGPLLVLRIRLCHDQVRVPIASVVSEKIKMSRVTDNDRHKVMKIPHMTLCVR